MTENRSLARRLWSVTPSKLWMLLYSFFWRRRFRQCGRDVRIHPPAVIDAPNKISIGNDVTIACHAWLNCLVEGQSEVALTIGNGCSIGRFAHINAYEDVVIEDHVVIADSVFISDCSHRFADPETPVLLQGDGFEGPVLIKTGAWIAKGAVSLPGTTIGRNSVVGANAVVNRDIPDNHLGVGVPAKVVTKRASRNPNPVLTLRSPERTN